MKTFVMGDIHGAYKALIQCLERSGFDYQNDTLIQLGDVVDGWSEVYECVEELLKIRNLIAIKGNHDDWFIHWMTYGVHPQSWTQGAIATLESYVKHAERDDITILASQGAFKSNLTNFDIKLSHESFFLKQHSYYIDEQNNCFVHGGFNRHEDFKGQGDRVYCWDRDLWMAALCFHGLPGTEMNNTKYKFKIKDNFKEIFIGHTATTMWKKGIDPHNVPMVAVNIWNMDTGAGFDGKLSIMNVETKELFQSDDVRILYKQERGRN